MSDVRLIVGLGNPGVDYEFNRHNLGFLVIQYLVEKLDFDLKKNSFIRGLIAEGNFEGKSICFLLPMTFMNNSGIAVKQIILRKKLDLGNVLVVCDDFNLSFRQLRLRAKGGDGGHNGIKSIIQHSGSEKFARLRMGIDFPGGKKNVVEYVLENFSKKECKFLDGFIIEAADCCLAWVKDGVNRTMERYNGKK